jgi:hypothetical protein
MMTDWQVKGNSDVGEAQNTCGIRELSDANSADDFCH